MLEAPDFSTPHFFEFEAVQPRPKVQVISSDLVACGPNVNWFCTSPCSWFSLNYSAYVRL